MHALTNSSKVFENSSSAMIYPTFSMGSLDDRIQVNFGQTQFLFNLKARTNVSHFINV